MIKPRFDSISAWVPISTIQNSIQHAHKCWTEIIGTGPFLVNRMTIFLLLQTNLMAYLDNINQRFKFAIVVSVGISTNPMKLSLPPK